MYVFLEYRQNHRHYDTNVTHLLDTLSDEEILSLEPSDLSTRCFLPEWTREAEVQFNAGQLKKYLENRGEPQQKNRILQVKTEKLVIRTELDGLSRHTFQQLFEMIQILPKGPAFAIKIFLGRGEVANHTQSNVVQLLPSQPITETHDIYLNTRNLLHKQDSYLSAENPGSILHSQPFSIGQLLQSFK